GPGHLCFTGDQGQDATALPGRLEVVVTVGSFADEGGEQVPRRDAARIDAGVAGDPFVTGRATHQSAAGDLGDLPGCGLEHGQRPPSAWSASVRSEEHTSELQSRLELVFRLLL